jgi:hypothetical protein
LSEAIADTVDVVTVRANAGQICIEHRRPFLVLIGRRDEIVMPAAEESVGHREP